MTDETKTSPVDKVGKPVHDFALSGKRIVVTRAPHQSAEMVDLLRRYGAEPLLYPCIDIAPPADGAQLDAALKKAANGIFDWLVVTSANTVTILSQRLAALHLSLEELPVAAVGPQTAQAVEDEIGLEVRIVAEKHTAEGLATALPSVCGLRIFLPQSEIARPVLADALRQAGAQVTTVDAYRTVIGQGGYAVPEMLARGQVEAITFTSSSTVRNFLKRLVEEGGRRQDLQGVCLAGIGPITAKTMEENGLPVAVVPGEYTLPALIDALESYFLGRRS
jgi:uroporphyrinogen-III synthase